MTEQLRGKRQDLTPLRWDIFCNVVDHFGDIGVSWRLARQLSLEFGFDVRLWVDHLATFAQFRSDVDPARDIQTVDSVEVLRWTAQSQITNVADVVIEAFGSRVPADYLKDMATKQPSPVWINLEYLSAESWIEPCHLGKSPHPSTGLVKHFFFPGFTEHTGGLIREHSLDAARSKFLSDTKAMNGLWRSWSIEPVSVQGRTRVSLFGYGGPAVSPLLHSWAGGFEPMLVLVPESRLLPDVARFAERAALAPGDRIQRGAVELVVLPFLQQDVYDRLLWLCHYNFVRGEDSFVRAQWAERPFVWQIYPQEGAAHWTKLYAFLDRYSATLGAETAQPTREFWRLWNRGETSAKTLGQAWDAHWRHRASLDLHAKQWSEKLWAQGDLATHLRTFVANQL